MTDARGRRVSQLDPVAMHLLHQHDVIPAEDLKRIAKEIDPLEVRRRPIFALLTPVWIMAWYGAFFGYFYIFKRWRGWDPVLVAFATFYFVWPIVMLLFAAFRARRKRWARIRRIVLGHGYCPHCGYGLRGCPADPDDGATVCPECGCAWQVPEDECEQAVESRS